jgi:hypothetical protein
MAVRRGLARALKSAGICRIQKIVEGENTSKQRSFTRSVAKDSFDSFGCVSAPKIPPLSLNVSFYACAGLAQTR